MMPVLMFILHEQVIKLQTPKLPKIMSVFGALTSHFAQDAYLQPSFALGGGHSLLVPWTTFQFSVTLHSESHYKMRLCEAKDAFKSQTVQNIVRKSLPNFGKVLIFEKKVEISSNFHIRSIAKICLAPFSNVI